jgi:hypothetical protein
MGRADGPPLDPADEASRTYNLLAVNVRVDGITLYWKAFGRQSWQTILAYHRAGAGRLPKRNTIGISPAGRKKVKQQAWDAWAAREAVERPKREAAWQAKRKPPKVAQPPKGPIFKELPKVITRPIVIEAPEGQLVPTGGLPGPAPGAGPAPQPRPKPKPPAPVAMGAPWKPAKTLKRARAWGAAHNVAHVDPSVGRPLTLDEFNAANEQIAKVPLAVHQTVGAAGKSIKMWSGRGITEHPEKAHLRGVHPRGWPTGKTWDQVPGAGGGDTYIVANRLQAGHGSANLILHEHAHTYERAHQQVTGVKLSQAPEWQAVHQTVPWIDPYQRSYPEESFAESFAKYYHSAITRLQLAAEVIQYFAGLFGP